MTTDTGIVQWYYGKQDERSEERIIEWIKYRDIEIAYQQSKSEVSLGKYRIDLNKSIQFNRADSTEQCPIKRQTDCRREDYLREERFFFSTISHLVAFIWISASLVFFP